MNRLNRTTEVKIEAVIDYFKAGHTARQTAAHFKLSERTIARYLSKAGLIKKKSPVTLHSASR